MNRIAISAAILIAVSLSLVKTNTSAQILQIKGGAISGVKSTRGDVVAYKGIPFAAPPVGNLRWKAPHPLTGWQGVKKCTTYGPSPMQEKPSPFYVWTSEFLIPAKPISEDCLYLNVWTKEKRDSKKPVLIWIYGGGFSSGGSGVPIYDGEAMARKGVVFVSINYRVGVFGFFAHPELSKESAHHTSGNYGLLDQIAALKWVQKNIAAFGGDPANVTIAGQSAGAMSVNALVASPLAKGLFQKAIAESGSTLIASIRPMSKLAEAEQQGLQAAQKTGSSSLADLRKLSAEDLLSKVKVQAGPIADGYVLPNTIPQIFAENKQNNIPLLTGWNADEGIVITFKSKEDFVKEIEEKYGNKAGEVLRYYPASTEEEAKASQIALSRDMIFALSGYQWARLQSSRKLNPVYVYNFIRCPPAEGAYVKYKSFHTAEVAYALDNLKFLKRPFQRADYKLSSMMSDYWVNFAKTGNPNGSGLPLWPVFTGGDNKVIVLGDTITSQVILDKARLDFMLSLTTHE